MLLFTTRWLYRLAHVLDACALFFSLPRSRGHLLSPLFPYTTLFRSARVVGVEAADHLTRLAAERLDVRPAAGPGAGGGPHVEALDRKSTRLNSSHSQTSYAVFCLKKKKNTTPHP